jgi:hypothetical protein
MFGIMIDNCAFCYTGPGQGGSETNNLDVAFIYTL